MFYQHVSVVDCSWSDFSVGSFCVYIQVIFYSWKFFFIIFLNIGSSVLIFFWEQLIFVCWTCCFPFHLLYLTHFTSLFISSSVFPPTFLQYSIIWFYLNLFFPGHLVINIYSWNYVFFYFFPISINFHFMSSCP